LLAARASYLAGFAGTATVLAGTLFGIPVYGTMAHSFIQAHRHEATAFEHFAEAQPANVILLLDTYDTEAAATKVVKLAPRLAAKKIAIKGVRLDSGDLAEHARHVRRILDEGGLNYVQIVASGTMDETALQRLVAGGAPIDSFAIGTHMTTSADAPYLDCAYKLQQYGGRPRRKRSEGKATWPGPKQVYRHYDARGHLDHDILALADEPLDGETLIQLVMQAGKRVTPSLPPARIREYAAASLLRLPEHLRQLAEQPPVPVHVSQALRDLATLVDQQSE
jgi:nicotinate phosphoribosyltransferase